MIRRQMLTALAATAFVPAFLASPQSYAAIEEMGEDILEYCIEAASGRQIPKAVQLNQDDFIPWKRGVSL